jgi:putative flippase GtrA
VTFCCVGVANTLVGLAIIFALKFFLGASDALANLVGYVAGTAMSFIVNKIYTFGHRRDYAGSAMRFLLVQICAYALNLLTVLTLVHKGVDGYLAQTLGIIPYSVCGFLGAKFYAFASTDAPPAVELRYGHRTEENKDETS